MAKLSSCSIVVSKAPAKAVCGIHIRNQWLGTGNIALQVFLIESTVNGALGNIKVSMAVEKSCYFGSAKVLIFLSNNFF